ncbi:unnamed protein product [Caenorhabditis brenneri]
MADPGLFADGPGLLWDDPGLRENGSDLPKNGLYLPYKTTQSIIIQDAPVLSYSSPEFLWRLSNSRLILGLTLPGHQLTLERSGLNLKLPRRTTRLPRLTENGSLRIAPKLTPRGTGLTIGSSDRVYFITVQS